MSEVTLENAENDTRLALSFTQRKANTWGYDLYERLVNFPPEILLSLKNNLPPPHLMVETAKELIRDPADRVERIDTRLTQISQEMKALKGEKSKLLEEAKPYRTSLRGFRAVLSPFRRVPFDVLREIALFTLPDHPSPSNRHSPLNICQVSSAWRAAALSLPQLWTTLHVRVDVGRKWQHAAHQVLNFIGRARAKPIELFLFFDHSRFETLTAHQVDCIENFLSRISPIMPLIKRLGIGSKDLAELWGYLASEYVVWNLPHLKYLHILNQFSWMPENLEPIPGLHVFNNLPLTHLSAKGPFLSCCNLDHLLVDWSKITNICLIETLNTRTWTDILILCPQLSTGKFTVQTNEVVTVPYHHRTHNNLEDLTIEVVQDRQSVVELLSVFHLPGLKKLYLFFDNADSWIPPPELPPPSTFTSFGNIRKLSFDAGWRDADYIVAILRETVVLETLTFESCHPSFSTVFKAMTFDQEVEPRCILVPNLTKLWLETSCMWGKDGFLGERPFPIDALAKMLNSRRLSQIPSGLQSLKFVTFRLRYWRDSDDLEAKCEFEEKTADCKTDGMHVNCTSIHGLFSSDYVQAGHPFETWRVEEPWEKDIDDASSDC